MSVSLHKKHYISFRSPLKHGCFHTTNFLSKKGRHRVLLTLDHQSLNDLPLLLPHGIDVIGFSQRTKIRSCHGSKYSWQVIKFHTWSEQKEACILPRNHINIQPLLQHLLQSSLWHLLHNHKVLQTDTNDKVTSCTQFTDVYLCMEL